MLKYFVFPVVAVMLLFPVAESYSQSGEKPDTLGTTFTGIYVSGGARWLSLSNLNSHLQSLSSESFDELSPAIELAIEFSPIYIAGVSNQRARFAVSMIEPQHIALSNGRTLTLGGYSFFIYSHSPIYFNESIRFAFNLGLGVELATLQSTRTTPFDGFLSQGITNSETIANFSSTLFQPGLRFDYRFNILKSSMIVSAESGYTLDFDKSIRWWGYSFTGAPDDSYNGFYFKIGFGSPLYP